MTLLTFLFHHSTCFHVYFIDFFGIFAFLKIWGFLMFMGFLIKSEPWVFVHASYKHDSHALISKFGDFVKLGKIEWNWLLLLIDWVIITYFILVVLFNWSIKGFFKIRFFKIWGFSKILNFHGQFSRLWWNWTILEH